MDLEFTFSECPYLSRRPFFLNIVHNVYRPTHSKNIRKKITAFVVKRVVYRFNQVDLILSCVSCAFVLNGSIKA